VPAKWTIAPLARLARQKVVTGQVDRELLSVYLNRGVVRFAEVDAKRTNATSEDLSLYQAVDPGDLVLNNQQAWRGSVGVSNYSGLVSPAYFVLKLSDCYLPRYADLLFRERSMVAQYVVCSKGVGTIQRNLYWPHLKRIQAIVPSRDEQAAIVRFLDSANGRLERAIRAKRKVIALLNEQKQAIIHRAVTCGLDSSVPLQPSGVLWLGDIPSHWNALRSKYLFREVDMRSESGAETHLSMSQKLGLIPSTDIEVRRLMSVSYAGAKLCEAGDLVLNRLKAHLGVFALAPQPGLISPDYTVLRPVREMDPRYFEAIYRSPSCRVELRTRAKGIVQGFWRLYTDDFYDIVVPVPPPNEQAAIMAFLDSSLTVQNTAIKRMECEIDLINEYRIRLIADVVTGQLDVREAATRLSDETPLEVPPFDAELSDEPNTSDEEESIA
jgi:type I restriction enzyme S subunit